MNCYHKFWVPHSPSRDHLLQAFREYRWHEHESRKPIHDLIQKNTQTVSGHVAISRSHSMPQTGTESAQNDAEASHQGAPAMGTTASHSEREPRYPLVVAVPLRPFRVPPQHSPFLPSRDHVSTTKSLRGYNTQREDPSNKRLEHNTEHKTPRHNTTTTTTTQHNTMAETSLSSRVEQLPSGFIMSPSLS